MIWSKIKFFLNPIKRFSGLFLAAIIILICAAGFSQSLKWQTKIKLKNTDELYAFAANDSMLYTLRLDYKKQAYSIDCIKNNEELLWINDTLLHREADCDFFVDQFELSNQYLFIAITEIGKDANRQVLVYDVTTKTVLERKQLEFDASIKGKIITEPYFTFSKDKSWLCHVNSEEQLISYSISENENYQPTAKSISVFELLPPDRDFQKFEIEDCQISNSGTILFLLQFQSNSIKEHWLLQVFTNGIELLTPVKFENAQIKQAKIAFKKDDLIFLSGLVFTPKNEIKPFVAYMQGSPLQLNAYAVCEQKFLDTDGRPIDKELENNLLFNVDIKVELAKSKLFMFFEWKEIDMGKGLEVAFEPIVVHRFADIWLSAFDIESLSCSIPTVIMKDQQTSDDAGLYSGIGYYVFNDELILIYNDNFNNGSHTMYKDIKLMDNAYDAKTVLVKYNGSITDRRVLTDNNSKKASSMPAKLFYFEKKPCIIFGDDVSYRLVNFEEK